MEITNCDSAGLAEIRAGITAFWGSDRTLYLHHPMLVYEFGNTAFVIKHEGEIVAYLFGFFSQVESLAYVHLVAVREDYKRQGLGKKLYDHFMAIAAAQQVKRLKAITSTDNLRSVAFHTQQIGMQMQGELTDNGIRIVKDYSGPGQDRIVFEKEIGSV